MPVSKNRKGHKKKIAQRRNRDIQKIAVATKRRNEAIEKYKKIIEENKQKQLLDGANEDRYEEE